MTDGRRTRRDAPDAEGPDAWPVFSPSLLLVHLLVTRRAGIDRQDRRWHGFAGWVATESGVVKRAPVMVWVAGVVLHRISTDVFRREQRMHHQPLAFLSFFVSHVSFSRSSLAGRRREQTILLLFLLPHRHTLLVGYRCALSPCHPGALHPRTDSLS
ncbi:hypothetical protein BC567DRAFT_57064 [Phyllosticta citribraziliensis]